MTATHTAAQAASAPAAVPVRRGAGLRAVRPRPRSRTARARFRHPGRGTLAASGARGRTTSRGRHQQSAVSVITPIEPARGPADDLVPVSGHPPFQPGVTRVLLRSWPYAGPVRALVSADADQVEDLTRHKGSEMAIRIDNGYVSLEIGGVVIAAARERAGGWPEVSCWSRFPRHQVAIRRRLPDGWRLAARPATSARSDVRGSCPRGWSVPRHQGGFARSLDLLTDLITRRSDPGARGARRSIF